MKYLSLIVEKCLQHSNGLQVNDIISIGVDGYTEP